MSLSALSIRYPRVLAIMLVTVIVWGGVAFLLLPRQDEPVLTWRLANVVTRLPGASLSLTKLSFPKRTVECSAQLCSMTSQLIHSSGGHQ